MRNNFTACFAVSKLGPDDSRQSSIDFVSKMSDILSNNAAKPDYFSLASLESEKSYKYKKGSNFYSRLLNPEKYFAISLFHLTGREYNVYDGWDIELSITEPEKDRNFRRIMFVYDNGLTTTPLFENLLLSFHSYFELAYSYVLNLTREQWPSMYLIGTPTGDIHRELGWEKAMYRWQRALAFDTYIKAYKIREFYPTNYFSREFLSKLNVSDINLVELLASHKFGKWLEISDNLLRLDLNADQINYCNENYAELLV